MIRMIYLFIRITKVIFFMLTKLHLPIFELGSVQEVSEVETKETDPLKSHNTDYESVV
jgi:hypothetical protein